MTDIYDEELNAPDTNADTVESRNIFPTEVPAAKDIAAQQDKPRTTVDFYQVHAHKADFGETSGLLSFYDPTNPDRQLIDIIEQEVIELGSPPIKLYRLKKSFVDIDEIYGETMIRDAFEDAVIVFGYYEDPTPIQMLEKFGEDTQEIVDITFNLNYLLNKFAMLENEVTPIPVGSFIMTYDNKVWEIMNSIILDESLWRAQHLNCKAIKVQPQDVRLPDYPNGLINNPNA